MYKVLLAFCIIGLTSFGVAQADSMDGDRVVRDEHVTQAAGGDDATAQNPGHVHASRDDATLTEAEHGQDLLRLRAVREGRSMPDTLELDSLGLYFGLGEHFVDLANSLIEERAGYYSERGGMPVYSRLSDERGGDLHGTRDDARSPETHEHESASGEEPAPETEGLNRRGADYDYFWD